MTSTKKSKLPVEKKILPAGKKINPGGASAEACPETKPEPSSTMGETVPEVQLELIKGPKFEPSSTKGKTDREEMVERARAFMRSIKPAKGRKASCPDCKWSGTIGDCKEVILGPSREGWEWLCPKCDKSIELYAFTIIE